MRKKKKKGTFILLSVCDLVHMKIQVMRSHQEKSHSPSVGLPVGAEIEVVARARKPFSLITPNLEETNRQEMGATVIKAVFPSRERCHSIDEPKRR